MSKEKIVLFVLSAMIFLKINGTSFSGTTNSFVPLMACSFDDDFSFIVGKFEGEMEGEKYQITFTQNVTKRLGTENVYECMIDSEKEGYILISAQNPKTGRRGSAIVFDPRIKNYGDGNGDVIKGEFIMYRFLDKSTLRFYKINDKTGLEAGPVYDFYRIN